MTDIKLLIIQGEIQKVANRWNELETQHLISFFLTISLTYFF
jgi:hypothetical protein